MRATKNRRTQAKRVFQKKVTDKKNVSTSNFEKGRNADKSNVKQRISENEQPTQKSAEHAPIFDQEFGMKAEQAQQQKRTKKKGERKLTKAAAKKRRFWRRFWALCLVFATLIAGTVLSVVLLFKITTIELQTPKGESDVDTGVYTEALVLSKIQIKPQENIFSFNAKEQADLLAEALPLLEQIEFIRSFPGTVYVRIAPAVETYTIKSGNVWLVLSKELRVISAVSEKPNLKVLMGATPITYIEGKRLEFAEDVENGKDEPLQTSMQMLEMMIQELNKRDMLDDVTSLVFAGDAGLYFLYQDRIAVEIGTVYELDYKMNLAEYILKNEKGDGCANTDVGTLDVSKQSANSEISAVFKQGTIKMPTAEQVKGVVQQDEKKPQVEDSSTADEQQSQTDATAPSE